MEVIGGDPVSVSGQSLRGLQRTAREAIDPEEVDRALVSRAFNGDVYHLRDQRVEGTLTGDLKGSYTQEVNVNYNNHDLRGNAWGTLVLITPDVTWECTYRVIVEDLISRTFVGHGDDGSEISGTWMQVFGEIPATLDGTILQP